MINNAEYGNNCELWIDYCNREIFARKNIRLLNFCIVLFSSPRHDTNKNSITMKISRSTVFVVCEAALSV